ncbi:MAG: SDR family oxidoreductase, partial [Rhodobacteraceae bacterium]|nr:SDR family oxidoreductase [Paracoccaceae bacterium]
AIIITGAAGGIGAGAARALAAKGAKLVLVDLAAAPLAALADELGAENTLTMTLDITSETDMAKMAEATVERFGRIDALIAAAGILRVGGQLKPLAKTSFDEWRKVIDINLTGTFLANRAVLGAMLSQKRGDIINISSVSGRQGRAFDAAYSASKFGIIGLSESLAEEVQREGVRVQTVLPDAVDTGLWDQSGTAALKPRLMLTPEHVAQFICYLLSLPRDAYLLNSVIAPIPVRRRKSKRS